MTKQYWIGGFYIDSSRNQITQNDQSQTIAPKALAVLTYLAENQGKVVSHEALLDKVWPDTIVSPNTLQRSIAQLRKALGDDGKVQSYIKTHAKQGYSLECTIRWHDESHSVKPNNIPKDTIEQPHVNDVNNVSTISKVQLTKPNLTLTSILVGIIILSIIGYKYLTPKYSAPLTFDHLRSITATDDKEFDASYTPDGQYIVFHRYLNELCVNKLWAKNIETQKETLLTENWGSYGSHSFSKDGKKLVFLATEPCDQPVIQKDCYDLVSLDFDKSLQSPQQLDVMLECTQSVIKKPTWLNNNDITLLQKQSDHWKLINYSITHNKSTDLYELPNGNMIDFAYSVKDDLIAAITIHSDGQYYLDMLEPNGHILSSNLIQRPQEIARFKPVRPSFDPIREQLIFSTGRQLFTLSYDGKVDKINLPFNEKMLEPVVHPSGKRVLLIKASYDGDIVRLPRKQITDTSHLTTNELNQLDSYPSFERTILEEDNALFQPNGSSIALQSERSGEQQLWISGDNDMRQLSHFPADTYISGIDWAADGQSLLVNANYVITQVFLDSTHRYLPLPYPVVRLFQWDSDNNTALMLVRIKGIVKFVEYNLNDLTFTQPTNKVVLWAAKTDDGRLIYKDHLDQFWQPGSVDDQHISLLDGQKHKTKSFVLNGNIIYAININNQLWSYNLEDNTFKTLGTVDKSIDRLTDINEENILMTIRIAAKKEVVELSQSE